jgi:hypothetical protein
MKINYFGEKRQNLKKLFERLQIYSISTFEIKILAIYHVDVINSGASFKLHFEFFFLVHNFFSST